jgi:hypothetical protein
MLTGIFFVVKEKYEIKKLEVKNPYLPEKRKI